MMKPATSATWKSKPDSNTDSCMTLEEKQVILKGLLEKLRPFQREAYEFATKGTRYERQWAKDDAVTDKKKDSSKKNTKSLGSKSNGKIEDDDDYNYAKNFVGGNGRILLADEMGLGKSITSLAIMAYYAQEWPLLILCPASLRHQWPCEIEKFIPSLPTSALHVVAGFDDVAFGKHKKNLKIVVAPYSLLQTRSAVARLLQEMNFQCVIADESHNIKERTSQKCKLAMPILTRAKRVVLLSGTPALARPVELWTQVSCIAPKLFYGSSFNQFTKRYCNAHRNRFGRWDVSGLCNAAELHSKLKLIMVRRLKSNVLTELPPKQRSIVPISIANPKLKAESQALVQQLQDTRTSVQDLFMVDSARQADFEARRLLMECYQASGIAKAPAVAEYLVDWLKGSSTQKILVFCHHTAVMDTLEDAITKNNKSNPTSHIRIDGSVPSKNRAVLVRKFQSNPRVRVALLSVTAAGVGLTLTAASSVLFAELHWTPGVLAQAEDRCHRIGQANAVNVMYCICKDQQTSVDMSLWAMLSRKVGTLGRVIDGCKDASMEAKDADPNDVLSQPRGESAADELVRFFAETSALDRQKRPSTQEPVAKGSILSFFKKPAASASTTTAQSGGGPTKTKKQKLETSTPVQTQRALSLETQAFTRSENAGYEKKMPSLPDPLPMIAWSCEMCTFENQQRKKQSGWLACEMCNTPYVQGTVTSNDTKAKLSPAKKQPSQPIVIDIDSQEEKPSRIDRRIQPSHPIVIDIDSQEKKSSRMDSRVTPAPAKEVIEIDLEDVEPRPAPVSSAMRDTSIVTPSTARRKRPLEGMSKATEPNEKPCVLKFSVSVNSGRVIFHSAGDNSQSMCTGFDIDDVLTEESCDKLMTAAVKRSAGQSAPQSSHVSVEFNDAEVLKVVDRLPAEVAKDSETVKQCCRELKAFVSVYLTLREVEKKALKEFGQAVSPFGLRKTLAEIMTPSVTNCTERYKGGARERARENAENGTATESDRAVLAGTACAWCAKLLPSSSFAPGVQAKYCSNKCAETGRLGSGGMYASTRVREQVFRLEEGVCQKCGMDAHSLYRRICALQPAERLNVLCNANWRLPTTSTALERLLQKPKEGDFWQADHIVAVAEGGGACGLDNLQTLCTPCHRIETDKLRARLRLNGAVGEQSDPSSAHAKQMDIRSAFPLKDARRKRCE